MHRRKIPYLEFYITNVCNLTCENCNRFNNHSFKGWQAWNTYKDVYSEWAKFIDIEHIVIMGVESLLNPDILKWGKGLKQLWPKAGVEILSNGFHINRVSGLYELLRSRLCWLGVTIHNINTQKELFDEIRNFLIPPITETLVSPGVIKIIDSNGVKIECGTNSEFTTSAVIKLDQNRYTLHQSDPDTAHKHCTFASNKCYHMVHGKLYKCGPVALFPEFNQQFNLELEPQDKELLTQYIPLSVQDYEKNHELFFSTLDQPIRQCKFCPDSYNFKPIFPTKKGSS
jgi:hypothetical protein